MDRPCISVALVKKILSEAPYSPKACRRIDIAGRMIAALTLLCSLAAAGCDFLPELLGYGREHRIAGLLPGSMSAHLYFRFARHLAVLRDDRRILLLAAFGALIPISLHVLLAAKAIRRGSTKDLSFFMLFEAALTCVVLYRFLPAVGFTQMSAVIGVSLRAGAAGLLLFCHRVRAQSLMLGIAEMMIWAAAKYGWPDSFNLAEITSEEYGKIEKEFWKEMDGT